MDSCTWTLEDPSNGAWGTECNNIFSLEDGTPSENRMLTINRSSVGGSPGVKKATLTACCSS